MKTRQLYKKLSLGALLTASLAAGMLIASGGHLTSDAGAHAAEAAPAPVIAGQPADFAALAEATVPSVVSVFSTDVVEPSEQQRQMPSNPFEFFFGPNMGQRGFGNNEPMVRQSAGSGFFISSTGELLTNNHVIEDADRIEIELSGGERYKVEVVGRDPATDVALLKVVDPDRSFPVLRLGSSAQLRVGEWVMAVGNPLNMDHTVTVGVVSAKGRVLGLGDSSFENFIQTDAAINFGNSGGPLINVKGEAVGINTAISAGGQNLGFAVPVDTVRRVLPQLRESGKVVRGYLGAQVRNITPEIQKAFNLDNRKGALVEDVVPHHAADKAGVRHGDVIVRVDGNQVANTRELIDAVSAQPPGATVKLEVIRDGKTEHIKVELEQRPAGGEQQEMGETGGDEGESRLGVSVHELEPRLRQAYGINDDIDGVVITRVDQVSPAGEEGLRPGDVIMEANGATIGSPEQLQQAIASVSSGGFLRLYVYRPRANRSFFAIIQLDEE